MFAGVLNEDAAERGHEIKTAGRAFVSGDVGTCLCADGNDPGGKTEPDAAGKAGGLSVADVRRCKARAPAGRVTEAGAGGPQARCSEAEGSFGVIGGEGGSGVTWEAATLREQTCGGQDGEGSGCQLYRWLVMAPTVPSVPPPAPQTSDGGMAGREQWATPQSVPTRPAPMTPTPRWKRSLVTQNLKEQDAWLCGLHDNLHTAQDPVTLFLETVQCHRRLFSETSACGPALRVWGLTT